MLLQHVLVFGVAFILQGCAFLDRGNALDVTGVIFENASYYPIANISLRVVGSTESVTCSQLPAKSSCLRGFPAEQYQATPIIVSWEQNGKNWTTGRIIADMPRERNSNEPMSCNIIIGNQGSYNTHFSYSK